MISTSLDKLFDPFASSSLPESNNSAFRYDAYDKIRTECSFHLPETVKNIITQSQSKLNILHINARSIVNKYDDFCNFLMHTEVGWHIISMSETWLSKSIENMYSLPGFRAYYCSRALGTGGGSALYIANNFSSIQLKNLTFTTAEVVSVQIKLRNVSFVVCQIYRSPSTDGCLFNSELEQCLIWLSKMNKTT